MPPAIPFKLVSDFSPKGDQPAAIAKLTEGLRRGERHQTLLGATGTGKTFTMANIVAELNRPTLVIAHNKTLAAQLCSEFQSFFPENAVSYFVSYYDYYQPEAYLPHTDTYIEKDASINEEIAKFRHAATHNLLSRRDVLIVASVSCIYGLGSVEDYEGLAITIRVGEQRKRDEFLRKLTDIQYRRSNIEFKQGMFHVLGDTVDVFPPSGDTVIRIEMAFDEIESITEVDSFTGEVFTNMEEVTLFPAKHDVTTKEKIDRATEKIMADLVIREREFLDAGELVKAERIRQRTAYDIEMLKETGYTTGIENYVRYLSNRPAGSPPETLLDYFPKDFLCLIDESHMTIPQIGGMHEGNKSRKMNLIDYGFRLPSCMDNRPLTFQEFESKIAQAIYISATPAKYEKENTKKECIAEQIIRPTGLLDPIVTVHPTEGQVDNIVKEINAAILRKERILITTLTKKMAEDLSQFLLDKDYKVKFLHSDIETMERVETLRALRTGEIDILVGVNLLREGLDLPEVSFIAILDADKQGFLRSRDALIQTIGRAARNITGEVIMYADQITNSMKNAISEITRRRAYQTNYNLKNKISPKSIYKPIREKIIADDLPFLFLDRAKNSLTSDVLEKIDKEALTPYDLKRTIKRLEKEMKNQADDLNFELAIKLRNKINDLKG